MANTFKKIATVTVGSGGASTIDFTSIPSTYTDLCVKVSSRTNRAAYDEVLKISFNASTTNFSWRLLNGSGSTASSANGTTNIMAGRAVSATATASTFSNSEVYIPNYTSSNNKSFSVDSVAENNSATLNDLDLHAGLWSNTAAINQITLTPETGATLQQYSTATLYGIKNS
jgi:hypothetical protein